MAFVLTPGFSPVEGRNKAGFSRFNGFQNAKQSR
jgi:hypothetical protein